jgi:hypothetical protein
MTTENNPNLIPESNWAEEEDMSEPSNAAEQLDSLRNQFPTSEGDDTSQHKQTPAQTQNNTVSEHDITLPIYCQDEPPEKTGDYIKWALLHGFTEQQLLDDDFRPDTVRIKALELEKEGLRIRPPKTHRTTAVTPVPKSEMEESSNGRRDLQTDTRRPKEIKTYAKGASAEAILNTLELPEGIDVNNPGFALGVKYGMSTLIMGIRMGQDLAASGIQLVKPVIEVARQMREGEIQAGESASQEAASAAATAASEATASAFVPYLKKLDEMLEKQKEKEEAEEDTTTTPAKAKNEMNEMMMKTFKPILNKIRDSISAKLTGSTGTETDVPDGWTQE